MKTENIKKISFVLILLFISFASYANVDSDLNQFFDQLGYASNVTSSHAYEGQEGGYFTPGSLFLRSPSRDIQVAHLSVPSLKAGCGGISLYGGGFSFIKGNQLIDFAKNIMTNSGPYAFQLAMETYAPQLNAIYSKLQYWSQQMNQNNLTSCQAAESLVGGLWAKNTAAQRQVCQDLGSQNNNMFADWAAAREGCGYNGEGDDKLNQLKNTSEGKKEITRDVNIVWRDIMQEDFLTSDIKLAEFFMSLSGTVIFNDKGNPTIYSSMIKDQSIIAALMNGGSATIYTCDNTAADQCLSLNRDSITIDPQDGLTAHIDQILQGIQNKYLNDEPLSDAEKGFLNSTSLPILKFIQVSLESGNQINTRNYAEIIAQDLLTKYLESVITVVKNSLMYSHFGSAQKAMMNSLIDAQNQVDSMKIGVYKKVQAETALINQAITYQKMIMGNLSSRFQTGITQ